MGGTDHGFFCTCRRCHKKYSTPGGMLDDHRQNRERRESRSRSSNLDTCDACSGSGICKACGGKAEKTHNCRSCRPRGANAHDGMWGICRCAAERVRSAPLAKGERTTTARLQVVRRGRRKQETLSLMASSDITRMAERPEHPVVVNATLGQMARLVQVTIMTLLRMAGRPGSVGTKYWRSQGAF